VSAILSIIQVTLTCGQKYVEAIKAPNNWHLLSFIILGRPTLAAFWLFSPNGQAKSEVKTKTFGQR